MRLLARLGSISENAYLVGFIGITLIALFSLISFREDAKAVERKILAKQKDLAVTLQLKDTYEAKKRTLEKNGSRRSVEPGGISLGMIEDLAKKNFVSGTLTALQPGATKEERGRQHTTVEIKVTGAALGEVVSFIKGVQATGLSVRRLRLTLPPSNASDLDMSATLSEGYTRG